MDSTALPADMAQFFDFGEAAIPDGIGTRPDNVLIQTTGMVCPAHGQDSTESCICLDEDFPLAGTIPQRVEPEWDPNFSNWLPRYQKPAHACDYCSSRSLECFIYNAGGEKASSCSPCNALFRPCSFTEPDKLAALRTRTALDTLDSVSEDTVHLVGGFTGRKPMRTLGHTGPIVDNLLKEDAPKRGNGAPRFPRAAVKILKDWLNDHADHPYPTEDEKEILASQTGLALGQISNWMANTRRRQKLRPKRAASPSLRPSTEPIGIPAGMTWDAMNPLERWKVSPPENEPAPLTAIVQAVETFDPPELSSASTSYNGRKHTSNDSTSSFSVFRAPSISSLETGFTHKSSGSSRSQRTAWSHGSRNSFGSFSSLNSAKDRRRRRKMPPSRPSRLDQDLDKRLWQCTFCCDRFKTKYDWTRHEQTSHLSLTKWICAPLGEVITCSSSGQRKCVYCDALDPSKEHLAEHNHNCCEEKGLEARTFYRKDHLAQHLRLMHACKMIPSMKSWKAEVQNIRSRCGFCAMKFDTWKDRADHLTKEFRNGATMKDWKGCRGLDPHVAAHVTNAMPPYLIANESKSPLPFSATNAASLKPHHLRFQQDDLEFLLPSFETPDLSPQQTGNDGTRTNTDSVTTSRNQTPHPNATCWEILTLRLGKFAKQHIDQHGPDNLTDEFLQAEARRILYDSDDTWNQTAADNPEWLSLFKKAHGIGPEDASGPPVVSQHSMLADLGLGAIAQLDRRFHCMHWDECTSASLDAPRAGGMAFECSLAGSLQLTQTAREYKTAPKGPRLSAPGLLGTDVPISELMCPTPGGVCIGENGGVGYRTKPPAGVGASQAYFTDPTMEQTPSITGASLPALTSQLPAHLGHPVFSNWDLSQLPASFSNPHAAPGGLSTSLPTDSSGMMQGTFGDAQVLTWDDHDVDLFGMDMDMDIEMEDTMTEFTHM